MKKHTLALAIALPFTLIGKGAPSYYYEQHKNCPMCGSKYDPNTVESLSGTVIQKTLVPPMKKGWEHGIEILLQTDAGEIPVHLGPSWYIEKQDMHFSPKDRIEVTGSKVMHDGKPLILAEQVHKDNATLVLRDSEGTPKWAAVISRSGKSAK